MALHKVRHALANWTNADGTPGMAFRGQVVEIPDAEAKRINHKAGASGPALIGPDDEVEHPGILSDLAQSPTDEEILTWIENANVSEVKALVSQRPELAPRIDGALTNVKAIRASEDAHLNDIRLAVQQGGLATDDFENGGVLGARSGHDATDTSNDGDNSDIIVASSVAPPMGAVTTLGEKSNDPAGASIAPVDSSAGVQGPEDNTSLKDANGTPDSLPAMDHKVLVEGPSQDVANYIAAHPEQAAAILEAETVHSEGSPRAEIVKAARAANGFTS
jgi:hypothetical protein